MGLLFFLIKVCIFLFVVNNDKLYGMCELYHLVNIIFFSANSYPSAED